MTDPCESAIAELARDFGGPDNGVRYAVLADRLRELVAMARKPTGDQLPIELEFADAARLLTLYKIPLTTNGKHLTLIERIAILRDTTRENSHHGIGGRPDDVVISEYTGGKFVVGGTGASTIVEVAGKRHEAKPGETLIAHAKIGDPIRIESRAGGGGSVGQTQVTAVGRMVGGGGGPTRPRKLPSVFDIVFDGPPGPEAGRFVEVEDLDGHSIDAGEWIKLGEGRWALRIAFTPAGECEFHPCAHGAEVRITRQSGAVELRCFAHVQLCDGDRMESVHTVTVGETARTTQVAPPSSAYMAPYYSGGRPSESPKAGDKVRFTNAARSRMVGRLDGVWVVEHVQFDLQDHTVDATLGSPTGSVTADVRNLLPVSFDERPGASVTEAYGSIDWHARPTTTRTSFADLLRTPSVQRMLEEVTVSDAVKALAWGRDLAKDLPPTTERSPRDLRDLTPREVVERGISALRQVGSGLTPGDAAMIANELEEIDWSSGGDW